MAQQIALSYAYALLPFTQDDLDSIYANQTYRDPVATEACSVTGAVSSNKSVYLIGDSWLQRLSTTSNSIENILQTQSGLTVVGNNYSVGRSINGGGEKNESALQAVEADSDIIRNAGSIIIVLGTNPDNYDSSIPKLINAIREISMASIHWVNTTANSSTSIASSSSSANKAINKYAPSEELGYNVVDFFSYVYPEAPSSENVSIALQSELMDTDKIHPKIPSGTDTLAALIASSLGNNTITPKSNEGSIAANGSRSSLPQIAKQRLGAVEDRIIQNQPVYELLSSKYQIPWQIFGALHYREAGADPNRSMLGGEPLGSQAVDSNNTPETLEASGDAAYGLFTNLAQSVYDVAVGPNMDFEDLQYAFLAYHRGFLYKNVPTEEGGPWPPDIAPYVMNLYDDSHTGNDGTGMQRPKGRSGNIGVRGKWGETVSGTDNPAGAMTFLAYFGYTPAGSYYGGDCESGQIGAGTLAWPVIDTSGNPAGRVTACWSDLRNKTLSGGSYYHSGIDIGAGRGTSVVAAQSGKIVYSGSHPTYGNLIIIDHGNGLWSHYGHLDTILKSATVDSAVSANEEIATVGNTGESLGDHLHFNLYNRWPFGALPNGAANSNGQETLNPFTGGLRLPAEVQDEVGCLNYPEGGREVDIAL